MNQKQPCVYIVASQRNGTLYTGVTGDLVRRIFEHKNSVVKGFTERYHVHCLVYFEFYESFPEAIMREKNIKKWQRSWKIELIESFNPEWRDLYDELI
jgi:putative endonuclease